MKLPTAHLIWAQVADALRAGGVLIAQRLPEIAGVLGGHRDAHQLQRCAFNFNIPLTLSASSGVTEMPTSCTWWMQWQVTCWKLFLLYVHSIPRDCPCP